MATMRALSEAEGAEERAQVVEPDACVRTAAQYAHHDSGRGSADWPAYLRMLDQVSPGYAQ